MSTDRARTGLPQSQQGVAARAAGLIAVAEDLAGEADCVVIITDHKTFDYKAMVERSKLIVDTRNALKGVDSPRIQRL